MKYDQDVMCKRYVLRLEVTAMQKFLVVRAPSETPFVYPESVDAKRLPPFSI